MSFVSLTSGIYSWCTLRVKAISVYELHSKTPKVYDSHLGVCFIMGVMCVGLNVCVSIAAAAVVCKRACLLFCRSVQTKFTQHAAAPSVSLTNSL